MAARLKNKVLVVVGGTSGIGLASVEAFLQAGARVVAVGRDEASCRAARRATGRTAARVLRAEAAHPDTAGRAIRTAVRHFGGFHGLFHVAGGSGRAHGDGPLHELADAGWDFTLRLNLTSAMYSNRAAVRHFLELRQGGAVLNLGSVLASSPAPRFFTTHAYAAAKAALEGMTRSAAACYAPHDVRFNVLAPGLVATPMSHRAQTNPAIMQFITAKQPLDGGRIGQPGDVAAAAVFLLSDEARFITGQVLHVDGGWGVAEGGDGPVAGAKP